MQIVTDPSEYQKIQSKQIYEDDLQFYGSQLLALVQTYRKHIYIPDDEIEKILNELEYYAMQIVNKQYQNIITNAHELITTDPDAGIPF